MNEITRCYPEDLILSLEYLNHFIYTHLRHGIYHVQCLRRCGAVTSFSSIRCMIWHRQRHVGLKTCGNISPAVRLGSSGCMSRNSPSNLWISGCFKDSESHLILVICQLSNHLWTVVLLYRMNKNSKRIINKKSSYVWHEEIVLFFIDFRNS